jgi:hypothetical protein
VRAKLLSSASRIENHAVDFGSTHPTEQRARPNDGGIRHSDRSHRSCRRRRSDHARLKHLPSVQLHREPLIATTWAQRSVRRRTLRLPAEGVIVRTVGVSQGMHQRTRMELISIVTATSVYAPVPVALDPFVEDSHLVGLFVRRSARCGRGKARAGVDPPRTASLDRLACWTAEPSNQVRVLAESPKASLLQADHLISRAAAFACEQRRRPDCRRRARRLRIRPNPSAPSALPIEPGPSSTAYASR